MTLKENYRKYSPPLERDKVNGNITAPEVRIVGDNVVSAVYPIEVARGMAKEQGLDLVEISSNAQPPVCAIVSYDKFKYDRKKKEKEMKAKAKKVDKKEIKLTLNINENDIAFKQNHAIRFLKDGALVDVFVQFKGREMKYKEQGVKTLETFLEILKPMGATIKYGPKDMGRKLLMTIELVKKNNKVEKI